MADYDFGDLAVAEKPDTYDFGDLAKPVGSRKTPKQLADEAAAAKLKAREKAMTVENPAEMLVAPVIKMATGAAGKVAGDVAGLGALATKALPFNLGYSGDPKTLKEHIERSLTQEPEGPVGQAISEYNPIALLGKAWGAGTHAVGNLVRGEAAPDEFRGMAGNFIEELGNQAPNVLGAKFGKGAAEKLPLKQQILDTQKAENAVVDATRNAAHDAGYITPPESGVKAALSGLAGKAKAEKIISEKNAENATQRLGKDVGAAPSQPLSSAVIENLKQKGYDAYDAMTAAAGPELQPTQAFRGAFKSTLDQLNKDIKVNPTANKDLEAPRDLLQSIADQKEFPTDNALRTIKRQRALAKNDFKNGNYEMGTARIAVANQFENLFQDNLAASGQQALVDAFKESRTNLAKLYLLDRVVNEATGRVDLAKLAALSETKAYKGVLTGEFKTAADFAKAYRKAAQKPTGEAAPRLTVFDGMFAGGTVMAALAGHPGALAVGGAELAGRVGVPAAAERGWLQNQTPSYQLGTGSTELPTILPAAGVGMSQAAQPMSALVANAQRPDPQHDAMMARLMWGR